MFSSTSGLHRLFSSVSSSLAPNTPRGQRQLESVTEEAHTYDLLYPEGETLQQGQHYAYPLRNGDPSSAAAAANSPDDRGGLDIQSPRDVRIIIAQDANALSLQPRVLYDSHPPLPLPQTRNSTSPEASKSDYIGGSARHNSSIQKSHTLPHTRSASLSQTAQSIFISPASPLSPVNELGSIFGNSRGRTVHQRPATSDGESAQSKIAREEQEERDNLVTCMFGSATGVLPSASSTKLHVRPPRPRVVVFEKRPGPGSGPKDSSNTGSFPKRRTPLTRSTTAADLHSLPSSAVTEGTDRQKPRLNSSSIVITRLFSVDPKDPTYVNHGSEEQVAPVQSQTGQSYDGKGSSKPPKAKQLKTPTYAVAIIVQMPDHQHRPLTPSLQRGAIQGSTLDRTVNSGLSLQPFSFDEPLSLNGIGMDFDRDIEYVVGHWSLFTRVLASLETVARCRISDALVHIDVPDDAPPVNVTMKSSDCGSNIKLKKPKQPTQRTLQLNHGALQQDHVIQQVAEFTGKRVVAALKTRRVVSGQGRWGIWREEARWVGKWAGGRDQNFFLFNLLTAFLGSHTEWLDSLGPSQYRNRHTKHVNDSRGEVSVMRHRTVIVSLDKMAARRLVFLLSAFLPGVGFKLPLDGQHQSEASWTNVACSQSPPSGIAIPRRQSLRRTMNRRTRGNQLGNNITSHARSVSFSESDIIDDALSGGQNMQQRSRRASDARSIRSAALPISSNGSITRKSSTTTTATVMPPVAHFSSHSIDPSIGTAAEPRPGSSGSLASLSLKRTLSRSESNEYVNSSAESQSMSRFGSAISGFWSGRRGSSTDNSDLLASSEEGLGISGMPKDFRGRNPINPLAEMVEELDMNYESQRLTQSNTETPPSPTGVRHLQNLSQEVERSSPARKIPERPIREYIPPKLSINENDGIIDVELPPTNSYSSSYGSNLSSPMAIHTAASSFNDQSSMHGRNWAYESRPTGYEPTVDVVGWLPKYHQDFDLQAVRPYDQLKEDIKRSMRTEPIVSFANTDTDMCAAANEWTDVCTTTIGDASNCSVTRLCLRRKNAGSPHHQANALLENSTYDATFQEEIIEEPIMDLDRTFTDAVEKVLAQSGNSSCAASRTPSPSRPRASMPAEDSPGLEVPRSECKRMVLGALEQVAKSVSAELANGRDSGDNGAERRGRENIPTDSTLREGVRRWLNEVGKDGI